MSDAEEQKFMEVRRRMENLITNFYECCQAIDLNDEGFAEDVNDAVFEATAGKVRFEDWIK